jgi:hypothetical protein
MAYTTLNATRLVKRNIMDHLINKCGAPAYTALIMATREGNADVIEMLIHACQKQCDHVKFISRLNSCMALSIQFNHYDAFKIFLNQNGIDFPIALINAILWNRVSMIDDLLQYDITDDDGEMIDCAFVNGRKEMFAKVLRSFDYDLQRLNKYIKQLTRSNGHTLSFKSVFHMLEERIEDSCESEDDIAI